MACLKGLIEVVLTHVRLTLEVDVLFYANEIAASIFVRIEVSSLIGSRTPSLTPRAQLMGSQKRRHVRAPPLHTLPSHRARFSCSLSPRASASTMEVLGPRPGALSSARYPPGYHGMGMFGAQMSIGMLAIYV